jgi:hypothetical protein
MVREGGKFVDGHTRHIGEDSGVYSWDGLEDCHGARDAQKVLIPREFPPQALFASHHHFILHQSRQLTASILQPLTPLPTNNITNLQHV